MSSAATTSNGVALAQILARLDGDFEPVANGVAEARYAFWIGSGISRDAVPSLEGLILRALNHLHSQMEVGNPSCRFRLALADVLRRGGLVQSEIEAIDLDIPPHDWAGRAVLLARMASKYSSVLEAKVEGERSDYLLWNAIDVRDAYANPALTPDAEHYCLAVLLLEGLIGNIASANWDGLIELAVRELAEFPNAALRVVVRSEDFRATHANSDLIKFHGCAVRASEDEGAYRELLVGMKAQIAGLVDDPDHAMAVTRLVTLVASSPTLMVGMSAQDADIQSIFAKAKSTMPWTWPGVPPAIAFAEQNVGAEQQTVLRIVYGQDYDAHSGEIDGSASLGVFAKPLLVGIVLWCLAEKLRLLARSAARGR